MYSDRENGISLLVPTKNQEKTIELCIESFLDFADEIIVVDNGSIDNTVPILKSLEKKIKKLKFYYVPELPDLPHNRQYAFKKSKFSWIVRIDSDYIAYTSGKNDIKKLRKKILDTDISVWPKAFGITQVNLYHDIYHTGLEKKNIKNKSTFFVFPPVKQLKARIIQYFPGFKFKRLGLIDGEIEPGRWEGVRFQRFLHHKQLEKPYWFHCEFKSKMEFFYRSERWNWRQIGDYEKFPTLQSYINHIVKEKYNTSNLEKAAEKYMDENFFPYLQKYDPKKYYPYPELLKKMLSEPTEDLF